MLEQLGSDYNNSLSFHGWRRGQVSPMLHFLTSHGGETGTGAFKICEFTSGSQVRGGEKQMGEGE